jgi:hypothetical protein
MHARTTWPGPFCICRCAVAVAPTALQLQACYYFAAVSRRAAPRRACALYCTIVMVSLIQ